ncbi:MAG: hypothetical protein ACRELC_13685, partial [Gemmatimonadota bacterium]
QLAAADGAPLETRFRVDGGNGALEGDGPAARERADGDAAEGRRARRASARSTGDGVYGESGFQYGGEYIVFVARAGRPVAVRVRTGVTDLDYSEVLAGLAPGDSVYILPSANLVREQQEREERIGERTQLLGGN